MYVKLSDRAKKIIKGWRYEGENFTGADILSILRDYAVSYEEMNVIFDALEMHIKDTEAQLEAQPAQGREVRFVRTVEGEYINLDTVQDFGLLPMNGCVHVTVLDIANESGYRNFTLEGDEAQRFLEAIAPVTVGLEVSDNDIPFDSIDEYEEWADAVGLNEWNDRFTGAMS